MAGAGRIGRAKPALGSIGAVAAQDTGQDAAPDSRTESATLSNAEIEALYRARQDSARMRFTDADVEFVTGMISHHAQALIMSELAPTHGASPAVETLAARIINAQRDEIALMQRWLADRGQPVPQVKIDGLNLMIEMIYSGVGENRPAMITTIIYAWVLQVPVIFVTTQLLNLNQQAIWWSITFASIVSSIGFYLYFKRGKWLAVKV